MKLSMCFVAVIRRSLWLVLLACAAKSKTFLVHFVLKRRLRAFDFAAGQAELVEGQRTPLRFLLYRQPAILVPAYARTNMCTYL